jgi:hypothetical protein
MPWSLREAMRGLAPAKGELSWVGLEAGDGDFESLLPPENWDMNERTEEKEGRGQRDGRLIAW